MKTFFQLREEFFDTRDFGGETVEIFKNPTRTEMKELETGQMGEIVRILVDKSGQGDVYIWRAEDVLHEDVGRYIRAKGLKNQIAAYWYARKKDFDISESNFWGSSSSRYEAIGFQAWSNTWKYGAPLTPEYQDSIMSEWKTVMNNLEKNPHVKSLGGQVTISPLNTAYDRIKEGYGVVFFKNGSNWDYKKA